MTGETGKSKGSLDDTLVLMRDLRARCDWDAAQTHQSLRPYLIEESLEVDDALRTGDDAQLREELVYNIIKNINLLRLSVYFACHVRQPPYRTK